MNCDQDQDVDTLILKQFDFAVWSLDKHLQTIILMLFIYNLPAMVNKDFH